MNRRTFLGLCGTAIPTGIAGCSLVDSGGTLTSAEVTIDPGDSEYAAEAFRSEAAASHDRYGDGGVWGRRRAEPEHELPFQGAWTATIEHPADVRSEHLLALYRLPPGPDGMESSQVWLWGGVTPPEGTTAYRIESGLSLPEGDSLGIYSPARDVDASSAERYAVESGRLDAATLATTVPLPGGEIGVGEATAIGEGGAYHPYWKGAATSSRWLVATAEIRWADEGDEPVNWSPAIEADG